ncbi:MAG: hypothetical protein K8F27_01360 [Sulfuricellaceae bacterium]|nr:hypothetical protein [Sulfuricellaceae bacterium]
MPDIRADLSQYYAAKALFERILGRAAFMRVKDYGPLSAWRENYTKLLRAVGVAAEATVEVADVEWKQEVRKKGTQPFSVIFSSNAQITPNSIRWTSSSRDPAR